MAPSAIAWIWLLGLALVMGALIFGAAGDLRFWQGWAFLAVFFAASALITQYLIANDPALLQRRVKGGPTAETEPAQRLIMVFMSFGFVGLIVLGARSSVRLVAGSRNRRAHRRRADRRRVLRHLPRLQSELIRFVHDRGGRGPEPGVDRPYAVVRHPMYAGALIYLLGVPLALGSYWGLVAPALMTPILIWRLVDEERVLELRLPGYSDYKRKVRYRLLPGVY